MWGQRSVPCSMSPAREQRSQTLKPVGWDGSPRPAGSTSTALRTRSWALLRVGQAGLPANSHQRRLWTPECGTFTELTTFDLFVLISLVFTSTHPPEPDTISGEKHTRSTSRPDPRDGNRTTPPPDSSCRHLPSACAPAGGLSGWLGSTRLVVTAGGQGQETRPAQHARGVEPAWSPGCLQPVRRLCVSLCVTEFRQRASRSPSPGRQLPLRKGRPFGAHLALTESLPSQSACFLQDKSFQSSLSPSFETRQSIKTANVCSRPRPEM